MVILKFNKYVRKFLLIILIFFSIAQNYGQEELEFLGVLRIKDTSMISYRLNLKLIGEQVTGYSVTSIGGPHETKSYVRGKYDSDKNILEFEEYGIEYTKSDIDTYDFCFVHFSGTVRQIEKQNVIQGKFFGKYEDGVSCIDGELMVRDLDKIYRKAKKTDKKIQKLKVIPDSVKQKASLTKTIDEKRLNIIKADENTSIFYKNNMVELRIWDAGKIDGDKITVFYNDTILLKSYKISKKIKSFKLNLNKGTNRIKIIAQNVGDISPNTAKIELLGDNRTIELLTNLEVGKTTNLLLHNTQ